MDQIYTRVERDRERCVPSNRMETAVLSVVSLPALSVILRVIVLFPASAVFDVLIRTVVE